MGRGRSDAERLPVRLAAMSGPPPWVRIDGQTFYAHLFDEVYVVGQLGALDPCLISARGCLVDDEPNPECSRALSVEARLLGEWEEAPVPSALPYLLEREPLGDPLAVPFELDPEDALALERFSLGQSATPGRKHVSLRAGKRSWPLFTVMYEPRTKRLCSLDGPGGTPLERCDHSELRQLSLLF